MSRYASIRGKGGGRLFYFLENYLGEEHEDILYELTPGWGSAYIYAGWGAQYSNNSDDRTHYMKWVEQLIMTRKAHGFLTLKGLLLAIYWWEGETDIPTFEFFGSHKDLLTRKQNEMKQDLVKLSEESEDQRYELVY